MALIGIYFGELTAGAADGTKASEGTGAAPITIGPLDTASNQESSPLKLALRCDSGYTAAGGATIAISGTTAAKWALAPDSGGSAGTFGAYGASLVIASAITAVNTLFWAKAKTESSESPLSDTSVDLVVTATISPV